MTVLSKKRHFRTCAGLLNAGIALAGALLCGCETPITSNTARTAVEQLLLSDVIEQGTDQMKFEAYKGKKALMDYKNLEPQVDKPVVQGLVERRLAECGVVVATDPKEADIIIQVLCPVLATDMSKLFIGTPAFPFTYEKFYSLMIIVPEIPLFQRITRVGYGKFSLNILKAADLTPIEMQKPLVTRAEYNNWTLLLFPWVTHNIRYFRESVPNTKQRYEFPLF